MFRTLFVALSLAAAPAMAQDALPPPADQPQEEAVTLPKSAPYKLKKVCRSQEVVGSSIPRTTCSTKRIYLKPGEEAQAEKKPSKDL